jgi:aminoglycoside phosphotransferase (APT) family kinase protein
MQHKKKIPIDIALASSLIATQFPEWADLPLKPVAQGGWDNRTFHLGKHMSIRLPSGPEYASKVQKEQYWLPKLAPHLPLPIPVPLAMGNPSDEYPWNWSVYQWIEGETVTQKSITNMTECAISLAEFLIALEHINATAGPLAGPHNFYRGGLLSTYDAQTKQAIEILGDTIDTAAVTSIWNKAIASKWQNNPVFIHGDVSAQNLLAHNGKLSAVIDFGGLGTGDPACDLAIAWTLFTGESRAAFRKKMGLDDATWQRGCGWALWKALIIYAGLCGTNHPELEQQQSKRIIDEIVSSYKNK